MRVESPFFEKSSSCFILKRSRGLGILTFGKIKKIDKLCKIGGLEIKLVEYDVILSKLNTPPKNDVKNFIMELHFYNKQDSLYLCLF